MILLVFATASILFTLIYKPYCQKKMNFLESKSNFSILIIVYSGSLLMFNSSEEIKIFAVLIILYFTLSFLWEWFKEVLDIFIGIHQKRILKLCPCFLKFYKLMKKVNLKKKMMDCFWKFLINIINFITRKKTKIDLKPQFSCSKDVLDN